MNSIVSPDSIWAAQIAESELVLRFKNDMSTEVFWRFENTAYSSLTAEEKMDLAWWKLSENQNSQDMPWAYYQKIIKQCVKQPYMVKSDHMALYSDQVTSRKKTSHAHGAHAKIVWKNLGGHSYSGMLAQETIPGIIRLSETGLPFADTDPEF